MTLQHPNKCPNCSNNTLYTLNERPNMEHSGVRACSFCGFIIPRNETTSSTPKSTPIPKSTTLTSQTPDKPVPKKKAGKN